MLIKKGIEFCIYLEWTIQKLLVHSGTCIHLRIVNEGRKNLRVRALFCPQQRSSETLSMRELSGSGRALLTELRVT